MKFTKAIAPSILSADFSCLGKEIHDVVKAGADLIHVDIMDGHFVPNLTIGPAVVKSIRKITNNFFDCHLMIDNPEDFIEPFAHAGANMISVHVEVCDLEIVLNKIKKLGCLAGAVINPPTDIKKLVPYLKFTDYVLVMTVNPGFGGQKIIKECVDKIKFLDSYRKENNLEFMIEVDGGIKTENIGEVAASGCDIFVAGSAIFGKENYKDVIDKMKKLARISHKVP